MRLSSSSSTFVTLLLISGCAVGPDYIRPEMQVPSAYKEDKGDWKIAIPQDTADQGSWWLIFNDSELNSLEEEATKSNQSITVAGAQYEQTLAIVREAKAGFFPTLAGTVNDTKSRSSTGTTSGTSSSSSNSSNSGSNSGKPASFATGSLQAAWELDLWGSVRRLVEADEAAAQASAAQLAAIRLSIQATLAQTYFQLRALDEAQEMLDESVTAYEKFLKITKNQYAAGTVSKLTILQAESQLQSVRVMALDNGIARSQYEHAIAVLLGRNPTNFSISRQVKSLTPPLITVQVPSALLERRPDIANAERLMAQANAQIGVAAAAFFPMLNLSGSRGVGSNSFGQLFSKPFSFWSLGAQATDLIFDGGSRAAAVDVADAAYQASVAQYRQTVLTAFQDVEDNLATLTILSAEAQAQEEAVKVAEKEQVFTLNAYKAGTLAATDVLISLYNVYTARRNAIAIAGRRMTAAIGLIKALGGSWKNNSNEKMKTQRCFEE